MTPFIIVELLAEIVKSADLAANLEDGPNVVLTNAAGQPVEVNVPVLGVVSPDKAITFSIISVDMTGATSIDSTIAPAPGYVFEGLAHDDEDEEIDDAVKTITPSKRGGELVYTVTSEIVYGADARGVVHADEYHIDVPAFGIEGLAYVDTYDDGEVPGSSSGACSMGFGLAAIAGLAALALRKRSK